MISILILSAVLMVAILASLEISTGYFATRCTYSVDAINIDAVPTPHKPFSAKVRLWMDGLELTPELVTACGLGTIAILGDDTMIGAGLILGGLQMVDGRDDPKPAKRNRVKWEKFSATIGTNYYTTINDLDCCVTQKSDTGNTKAVVAVFYRRYVAEEFSGVNAVSKAKQWASKTARKIALDS